MAKDGKKRVIETWMSRYETEKLFLHGDTWEKAYMFEEQWLKPGYLPLFLVLQVSFQLVPML